MTFVKYVKKRRKKRRKKVRFPKSEIAKRDKKGEKKKRRMTFVKYVKEWRKKEKKVKIFEYNENTGQGQY